MSEEILKVAKADIASAEENLKVAKDLIDRLKKTGEDTSELERNYRTAEARLRRFKRAFEAE